MRSYWQDDDDEQQSEYDRQVQQYRREVRTIQSEYVSAVLILFQVLMGLALTTGVVLFFTGGNGIQLRPLSSYGWYEILVFIVFVFNVIAQTFSVVVSTRPAYQGGYLLSLGQRVVVRRFIADSLFAVTLALGFVLLALTLTTVRTNSLMFYYLYGILLALYSLYEFAILIIGVRPGKGIRAAILGDALRNLLVLGIGSVLVLQHIPDIQFYLLALTALETLLDTRESFNFPGMLLRKLDASPPGK